MRERWLGPAESGHLPGRVYGESLEWHRPGHELDLSCAAGAGCPGCPDAKHRNKRPLVPRRWPGCRWRVELLPELQRATAADRPPVHRSRDPGPAGHGSVTDVVDVHRFGALACHCTLVVRGDDGERRRRHLLPLRFTDNGRRAVHESSDARPGRPDLRLRAFEFILGRDRKCCCSPLRLGADLRIPVDAQQADRGHGGHAERARLLARCI